MIKILLVQCPCAFGIKMPPLGIAYLSAFLKKNNYDVSILDLSIMLYGRVSGEHKQYWDSNKGYFWYLTDNFKVLPFLNEAIYEQFVEKILSAGSDILGFSVQNTSAVFTLEIIKRIKKRDPEKKIILGGPNCYNISGIDSDFQLNYGLQEFADIIVVGEGEQTMLNIVRHLEKNESLDSCKGLAVFKEGKWCFNGRADPIINLDDLPFPDFEAYNVSAYTDKNTLPILSSRGCVMRCVFCTDTSFWSPYRYRTAENVAAEIFQRHARYKNNFFDFNDALVNGNPGNLLKLCDLLIDMKLGISWGGNCRVDNKLDLRMLKRMKKSGCEYLTMGVESGSNKILKLMRKGFTIEEVGCFIDNCRKAGIALEANWIVGFPGETEEDFQETVKFIEKNKKLLKKNNFTSLTINQFSYLEKHKDEFGIVLNGPHLGLWNSSDGQNTIELRNSRLQRLENIERERDRDYGIIRQTTAEKK